MKQCRIVVFVLQKRFWLALKFFFSYAVQSCPAATRVPYQTLIPFSPSDNSMVIFLFSVLTAGFITEKETEAGYSVREK